MIMVSARIFLLGLPGSGKSTVARSIASFSNAKRWSTSHFNDYTVLRELLKVDISYFEGMRNQLIQLKSSRGQPKEYNLGLRQQLLEILNIDEDPAIYSEFIDYFLQDDEVIDNPFIRTNKDDGYDYITYLSETIALLGRILFLVICSFSLFERLIQRFLAISLQILNRVSRSPSPQKKEPPVGGVKVGGKQYDVRRHVAGILYLNQKLNFAA